MNWVPYLLFPVAAFFGAGAVSIWRTDHRGAAVVLVLIAAALVVAAILWLIPAS